MINHIVFWYLFPHFTYVLFYLVCKQNRCVNMIARLFNAEIGENENAIGAGTVGSSEAIMLAGLAFKKKWQNKRKAEGKPYDKPNMVTGANVQVYTGSFIHSFFIFLLNIGSFIHSMVSNENRFGIKNDSLILLILKINNSSGLN